MSADSPVETEIKIRVSGPEVAARIQAAGFEIRRARVFEGNNVYDTPASAIRAGGELLRLREAGGVCTLTWKGPALATGNHKIRTEIETSVGNARAMDAILRHLGYSPTFRYEKFRTEFGRSGEAGTVTLDETPIGTFLELEGDGEWIDATAKHLGFSQSDYVTASYAGLYLEYCRSMGQAPAWMIFPSESEVNAGA